MLNTWILKSTFSSLFIVDTVDLAQYFVPVNTKCLEILLVLVFVLILCLGSRKGGDAGRWMLKVRVYFLVLCPEHIDMDHICLKDIS